MVECVIAGTAVNYFDRFLCHSPLMLRQCAELTALTCFLLASKFLQTKVPSLRDLQSLSVKGFSAASFAHSELEVLQALDWQLAATSPHAFVAHFVAIHFPFANERTRDLIQKHAEIYIDLSVFEIAMLPVSLGTIAGAAFLCALHQMKLSSKAIEEDLYDLLAVKKAVVCSTIQVQQHTRSLRQVSEAFGPYISMQSLIVSTPSSRTPAHRHSKPSIERPSTARAASRRWLIRISPATSKHSRPASRTEVQAGVQAPAP
jgi:hypothetical protein